MDFDPRDYDSRDNERFDADRHRGGRGSSDASHSDEHGLPTVAHAFVRKRERRLVRPAGLEPATPGLGNRCSILLSYGRAQS